jgi:hypothetical protein
LFSWSCVSRLNNIFQYLEYKHEVEAKYSLLLRNAASYLPNYKPSALKTVIHIVTVVRTSNISSFQAILKNETK